MRTDAELEARPPIPSEGIVNSTETGDLPPTRKHNIRRHEETVSKGKLEEGLKCPHSTLKLL